MSQKGSRRAGNAGADGSDSTAFTVVKQAYASTNT